MKSNFWSPIIAVSFGIISIMILYHFGLFPSDQRVAPKSQYPEYAELVVGDAIGWQKIDLLECPTDQAGWINNNVTREEALDGFDRSYASQTSDRIVDAYLYFEGSVKDRQLNFTRDSFYFKISGVNDTGGYILNTDNVLPTPPSEKTTRILLDLSNISYYTNHQKAQVKSNVNFVKNLNDSTKGNYWARIVGFIASQDPPTTMHRLEIFYRYDSVAKANASLKKMKDGPSCPAVDS